MKLELKPCPFCGCKVNFNRVKSGWNKIIGAHSDSCPIKGNDMLTWSEMDDAPIIEKWNKRINMHDELVKSLRDMVEIVGSNFCQNMEIKRKYKTARELLERCK